MTDVQTPVDGSEAVGTPEREGRQPKPVAVAHPTPGERAAKGKAARAVAPRSGHGDWEPASDRRDPVELLEEQAAIAGARAGADPLRADAGVAVHVLPRGGVPDGGRSGRRARTGLQVQLCGDAHLSNFGAFAAPDRRLVFSINDFDETLPGPFEWDVKRLVASFAVAGRDRGFDAKQRRVDQSGRDAFLPGGDQGLRRDVATSTSGTPASTSTRSPRWRLGRAPRKQLKRFERNVAKARSKDSMKAFAKLTTIVDGEPRIASDPPLIVPIEEVASGVEQAELEEFVRGVIRSYRRTLSADRRRLLERFRYVHAARKVVGVGSVGTRAWIVLMLGRDESDPLFLQLKEAQASVLEPFLGKSTFAKHGQRVVEGQRLTQAASDIMLGWIRVDRTGRREPGLLHPPALGRQGLGAGRDDEPAGDDGVRGALRPDARQGARPLRGRDRDRELPRHGRQLRSRAGLVRRGLRRPERARLRRPAGGRRVRPHRGRDRPLTASCS